VLPLYESNQISDDVARQYAFAIACVEGRL
jgi:hypothetical protein